MSSNCLLPELVLPAGNMRKLQMALAYGADAAYVGAAGFSMRPDGSSFTIAQLREGVELAHNQSKRLFVGVNCLMAEGDLAPLSNWLEATRDIPMDALIIGDLGALSLVREHRPDLPIHISTQMSTANSRAAAFLGELGSRRVVLARECSLAGAAEIAAQSGVEVEVFVHGAMCVAISGRCLLSAHLCGQSGSKGACKHSCRWEWQLVEQKRPGEAFPIFETERGTIFLGSTDLCLIEHIPELVQSGVQALKVEGRMKSEHYVAAVARVYRKALDAYAADPDGYRFDAAWLTELEAVSHRPFATGFAFGYPEGQPESIQTHNRPVSTHDYLGYIERESGGVHRLLVKNPFAVGDILEWIAPNDTAGSVAVESIVDAAGEAIERSHCGTAIDVRFGQGTQLQEMTILRTPREDSQCPTE